MADEMRNLFVGQSFDLHWTFNLICPSIEEYYKMVDNSELDSSLVLQSSFHRTYECIETGGLFRLLSRLMVARSTLKHETDLGDLPTLFGRFFQIRDDYQNLVSADVRKTPPTFLDFHVHYRRRFKC